MPSNFNKKIIAKNFSRAANSYNQAALVQKYAAEKLCHFASPFLKQDAKVLDLGAGTGFISEFLQSKKLQIFECDLSLKMLKTERLRENLEKNFSHKIQCDFENLPFKNHSFDVLISSFSLQWLNNFEKSFLQFRTLLKPEGFFIFALPTKESLQELRIASIKSGCNFHFNNLPCEDELKLALENSGLIEKFHTSEIIKSEFNSPIAALRSIKKTGANYFSNKHFVTKNQLEQFSSFCLKNFANTNKKTVISWNISFFVYK